MAPVRQPGTVQNLAAKVRERTGKSRQVVAELLRQGRREADLFRRELSRYIKAVHVYADGLVRVTASLAGTLDYPPVSLRKCGSGGGI